MANMTIYTKEAANGYIVDVYFNDEQQYGDDIGFAQHAAGRQRQRSYIASDKAEIREIINNLIDAE